MDITASGTFDDGSVIGFLLGAFMAYFVVVLVILVLTVIANWRIFSKCGEAGWKSIIPFYSTYMEYKLFWQPKFFWLLFGVSLLSAIFSGVAEYGTCVESTAAIYTVCDVLASLSSAGIFAINCLKEKRKAACFGKGLGFTFGLIFLNTIFVLILGFGSAQYQGNPDAEEE